VLCWREMAATTGHVRAQVFDGSWNEIGAPLSIPLATTLFGADVCALHTGGFAIAWSDKREIKLRTHDALGNPAGTQAVGISDSQIPETRLVVFSSGEVGVTWQESLIIRQLDSSIRLSSMDSNAFHTATILLPSDRLLRLVTTQDHATPYGVQPRYGIQGKLFDRFGHIHGDFSLNVPTTVVGDTYSHPQDLSACVLEEGGFVLTWTQLAHHRGNSIKAHVFAEDGSLVGGIIEVRAASQTSSVNSSSVAPMRNGSFVIGWSESEDKGEFHKTQVFSHKGARIGEPIEMSEDSNESRGAIKLAIISTGDVVGLWIEDQRIKMAHVAAA
jgi:hypothetical protein